jgi:hypothetical protein
MVVRFMLWKKHVSIEGFGNFRPKLTREQFDLFKELYSLLVWGSALKIADLAPISHHIVFSAYTLNVDVQNKVDNALEQSLVFTILTPIKGWYISALSTTQLFAHIQRIGLILGFISYRMARGHQCRLCVGHSHGHRGRTGTRWRWR